MNTKLRLYMLQEIVQEKLGPEVLGDKKKNNFIRTFKNEGQEVQRILTLNL